MKLMTWLIAIIFALGCAAVQRAFAGDGFNETLLGTLTPDVAKTDLPSSSPVAPSFSSGNSSTSNSPVPYQSLWKRRLCFIFSGGTGLGGSVTSEAIDGFSETKFKGKQPMSLSARMGILRPDEAGFGLDVSYFRFPLTLEKEGVIFGDVIPSWTVITPGVMMIQDPGNRRVITTWFLGLIGLGFGTNEFSEGEAIGSLEQEYGGNITVDTKNSFVVAFFPAKGDVVFFRRLALGVQFSGLLAANAETTWYANDQEIPDIEKFYLSNWQILGTLGIVLY
jgi:hypothetical protein